MDNQKFTRSWKRSVQPRKQRKYRFKAPLHIKQKLMHVHLSPELREKYSLRNFQLRKGDKIKVLSGQFKKKEGKVERIDLKKEKAYVTGIERIKKEGTKYLVALHPSKLMILELNLEDKRRKEKIGLKEKKKNPTSLKKEDKK